MPLALDLLLWLGPRLSLSLLMQPVIKQMGTFFAANAALQPQDIQNSLSLYGKFFQAFNLLGILRTFPIGVSSLMSGIMPTQTPWGTPAVLEISSVTQVLGLSLLLTVTGWMLGGLYFRWVAALAAPGASSETFPAAGRAILQSLFYAIIWSLVLWVVGLPVSLVIYVLFAINTLLGEGVLLLIGFLSMWLVVPIFFSPHGMFVRKQNALASILSGFRLTRFTLPTSSLFVLTVFLLGIGLNFLWSKPANDSWLVVIGIFGHAFITTALLASSFVYYDKMTTWLQLALERLRAGLPGRPI
ncbi:MAG TPA: hypothetical protein VF784_01805 [Anaerolineales bacterium]